jgi:outer membrane cobalamin receptor
MRGVFVFIFLCVFHIASCQYSLSGKILEAGTDNPVEYASLEIGDHGLWAVTDEKGAFFLKNVSGNEIRVTVSCLGYAKKTFDVKVTGNMRDLVFYLQQNNLALEEVVITAKSKSDEIATSYVIDRAGLDHLQMSGVADAMSLLPGRQTNRNLHLASGVQRLAIRGATGEMGNSTFGTAVEADGVRLSDNAVFNAGSTSSIGEIYGIDTRNIATHNIESIEIITGIPSVEYGDLSNGVVKINSRKGKSPLLVELATKPNTKQVSVSKGFDLKHNAGVLNASIEYAKSISEQASPYTSYGRNSLSLIYENTFNKQNQPLTLTAGIAGNAGGYDDHADPDSFRETYSKVKDNTLRGNLKLNWLLNKPWITHAELSATVSYSDNLTTEKDNKSSSSSIAAIHGLEEGYFVAQKYDEHPDAPVVLIPAGYWYQTAYTDSKPLNYTVKLKAKWAKKFHTVQSNLMLGTDFTASGNKGKNLYYDDLRNTPDWREYRYDQVPFMNTVSAYLEEKLDIALGKSMLKLMAGLRSDITLIKNSAYGTVGSLSPRFNAKYITGKFSVHAGWGKAVKLPSFSVLYPSPAYSDKLAFAPGAMSDGTIFYAYYLRPYVPKYNPDLKRQYNQQAEIGFEARLKGVNISTTFYKNKLKNSYTTSTEYTPFEYKYTDPKQLESSIIPSGNRIYSIDRTEGIVTVSDKSGQYPDEMLAYREMKTFKSTGMYINGSPSTQSGIDWVIGFDKIEAIMTSVRLDGSYYHYKGVEETITAYSPVSQIMKDGNPYKYVGYYAGTSSVSNGSEKKNFTTNLTLATHIPAIRMIFSLRLEGTLYNYTQNLSEYSGGQRSFALDDRAGYFPANDNPSGIYNSDRYTGIYPLYYTSYEDMNTKIPFAEKFAWARDNDQELYNELAKLVGKSNTDYYFNANTLSAYYSANISVTKEIGDHVSMTFNAINFLNNTQLIRSGNRDSETTIYGTSYIPKFYYGLTLRIKI